uniref:uncharacterized protein LOC120347959 n=1 Tax=Styela clava TaxID=7725 RepID=UPI00193A4317|nr:uncharacterized protein LOC120347959 [Styela clava]
MLVLAVGFPKTGTKSLGVALAKLGYKTYDYDKTLYYLGKEWMKIVEHGGTKDDFYKMYKDVDASVDGPTSHFWHEILEAFPDTKIIFMVKDSEENWWKSFEKTCKRMQRNYLFRLFTFLSPTANAFRHQLQCVSRVTLGTQNESFFKVFADVNPTIAKQRYRNHNANVLMNAPKDQLLEFHPREGWEKLCKFLNKPIPDVAFPHKNKNGEALEDFMEESPVFRRIKMEVKITTSLIFVLISLVAYYVFTLL